MKTAALRSITIAGMMIAFAAFAAAQDADVGKTEYLANCASCHGVDAKGDGPVSKELKTRVTDLTGLAKKNKGVFPLNSIYRIIDGRDPIASHGTREMPVWGYRFVPAGHFNLRIADDYIYSPPGSPEPVVHARILAVIDYLSRIQEK